MEKRGLGRGLGALIPGADDAARPLATEVRIDRVSVSPYQPREHFDEQKMQELVNSIRVHGVLQPIVVRSKGDGEYELVAGERRLRAASTAGLQSIPAVVRELTSEQSLEIALIENIQREDINPMDAAVAYKRLTEEFGLSQEDLAFTLGKSRSAVANTLRLLGLPREVAAKVRAGALSEGHARAVLSLEGHADQLELAQRIVQGALSVRDAERLAREWAKRVVGGGVSRETSRLAQDPNILEIEARLREVLRTKVTLLRSKDSGRIVIEFYSDADLERILNLLAGA